MKSRRTRKESHLDTSDIFHASEAALRRRLRAIEGDAGRRSEIAEIRRELARRLG